MRWKSLFSECRRITLGATDVNPSKPHAQSLFPHPKAQPLREENDGTKGIPL
jgi:hypothetical protein